MLYAWDLVPEIEVISGNKIRFHYENRNQVFMDDIRNFTIIKGK